MEFIEFIESGYRVRTKKVDNSKTVIEFLEAIDIIVCYTHVRINKQKQDNTKT